MLGPIKTKVGYFAIKEVNLGTFISEKINAFFQKWVSAFESRLQSPKKEKTFLYKTVFKRALFTTKSEFLMRDRALHISHNAAALS